MTEESQVSLFDVAAPAPSPVSIQSAASSPDAFGCCSRYRTCSDAGKCVIAGWDYSANCLYRKNLEAGRIFCGKNASGFDQSEYAGLC